MPISELNDGSGKVGICRKHGIGRLTCQTSIEQTQLVLPEPLVAPLAVLRRAYPDGVPAEDYGPLLVALFDDFSNRHLAQLVAELVGREPVVVDNDVAVAVTARRPARAEVARVRGLLLAAGYRPDDD